MTFFWEAAKRAMLEAGGRELAPIRSEMPDIPVYLVEREGRAFALAPAAVGAPLAGAQLEELVGRGAKKIVVCGGAGVLDSSIACGEIVVPLSALRDEGTSYHYMPPGNDSVPCPKALAAILETLETRKVPYRTGRTWTTDAIYRETPAKIHRRKEQGCITVEMEAAALFAIAAFRGASLGQLLYGGDDVGGEEWSSRGWNRNRSAREGLLELAIEACLRL
jgi:uridine phosphorylase